MKICIITGPFMCLPPHSTGAIEKIWAKKGEYMGRQGDEVIFVSKRPILNEQDTDVLNRIYVKGYDRTKSWWGDLFLDLIYSYRALKAAPLSDIVVLNSIWSPILYPLFKRKLKHALYNVARFPKKQLGLYKAVDCLSCVSVAVYNAAIKQTPSLKNKICVINNPIDTELFTNYTIKECSSNPTIVYSGRIHEEKGLDILVRAINILVEQNYRVKLTLIGPVDVASGGSGEKYKRYLESIAESYKINWVKPLFSAKDLAKEISKGDIFCYPSVASKGETFGVAPLEAMGLGLPTIVSALDCFKDFVEDGKTGLVFNHMDKEASQMLALLILKIIESKELYQFLSKNGSEKARCFSVEKIVDAYREKFIEIINEKTVSKK